MNIRRFAVLAVSALALVWTGCLFSPKEDDPIVEKGNYAEDLSVPDSLVHNLIEAYNFQDINPYANLLARDYKFEFQSPDEDFPDGMNFTQDSTSTRNMFTSSAVTKIDLTMNREPVVNAKYEGEDTKMVAINNLLLEIDTLSEGIITTLQVEGDIQYYHMVPGDPEDGEDPERYYIRAWLDVAGQSAPRREPLLTRIQRARDAAQGDRVVVKVTMSELHAAMSDLTQLLGGQ